MMDTIYSLMDAVLPFAWLGSNFMKNAFLAVLLVARGLLGDAMALGMGKPASAAPAVAAAHADPLSPVGEPVGDGVHIAIGDRLVFESQGRALAPLIDRRLNIVADQVVRSRRNRLHPLQGASQTAKEPPITFQTRLESHSFPPTERHLGGARSEGSSWAMTVSGHTRVRRARAWRKGLTRRARGLESLAFRWHPSGP